MRAFDEQTTGQREAAALQELAHIRQAGAAEGLPAALDRLIPPFPLKVQIQTWTRCNASCGMCPYPEITGEPGFVHQRMEEDLYKDILAQLRGRGVERLSLFLMNEPLLDRRMPQWLSWAREALPGVTLNLFTNGSPLTPALARRLADAGLNELCISVHGFDAHTYERVMGLDFERARKNLDAALALSAAGELGAMALKIVTGDLPELAESLKEAPEALKGLVQTKGFSNERRVSEVSEDLPSSAGGACGASLCQRPFIKLYILSDGSCVLCNADWRRQVILGRLGGGHTIESIWRGARYTALRALHLTGDFPADHPCARCDYPEVVGAP